MSFDIGKLQEKLPEWIPFAHPPNYRYVHSPTRMIDFTKLSLWVSVGAIFFNPIFWNFVARNGEPLSLLLLVLCSCQEAAAGDIWSIQSGWGTNELCRIPKQIIDQGFRIAISRMLRFGSHHLLTRSYP